MHDARNAPSDSAEVHSEGYTLRLMETLVGLSKTRLRWKNQEQIRELALGELGRATGVQWVGVIQVLTGGQAAGTKPVLALEWGPELLGRVGFSCAQGALRNSMLIEDLLQSGAVCWNQRQSLLGSEYEHHTGSCSVLLVPLMVAKQFWGALALAVDRLRSWSNGEIAAAQIAASFMGSAIEQDRALELLEHSRLEQQEQAQHLELLLKFRSALNLELDLDSAIRNAVELVSTTFGYDLVSIYLREGDSQVLKHQVGYSHWYERLPIGQGISSRCLLTGHPVHVEDARLEPDFIYAMPDILSQIAIPLQVGAQTVGVLNVESRGKRLNGRDFDILQSVGAQINLVLERAYAVQRMLESERNQRILLERTQEQNRRLEFMLSLRESLYKELKLEEILRCFVDAIYARFGHGLVVVYWREGDALVAKHHQGYPLNHPRIPIGKGLTSRCYRLGEPILLNDPLNDPDFLVVSEKVTSALFVPITINGCAVGTVNIESENHRFGQQELDLLVAAVAQLSLVLERNQALGLLTQSEERFRMLVETLNDGLLVVNAKTLQITYANATAQRLLEATHAEQLIGTNLSMYWVPERLEQNLERVALLQEGKAPIAWVEQPLRTLSGKRVPAETSATILPGEPAYFVSVLRDVRERNEALRQIEYLAYYDPLTGMLNRRGFLQQVEFKLQSGGPVCLVYLDFNEFKMINDVYGHHVGDLMLHRVAERLQKFAALVGRIGGDEFVVLIEADEQTAEPQVQAIVKAFEQPLDLEGRLVAVSIAAGVAQYPRDAKDVEGLLRAADVAMYQAKRTRQPYQFYNFGLDKPIAERLELMQALRLALRSRQIEPNYQPIVHLREGNWQRVELLARWIDPQRGRISPAQFIPLAQEMGELTHLDRLMVETGLEQLGGTHLQISLNLSPKTLLDASYLNWFHAMLEKSGVHPGRVCVEITEDLLIEQPELAARSLLNLRRLGVRVALDDFGKGYSSLTYLKDLPIDLIKLDQGFVAEIGRSSQTEVIIRGLFLLAQSLGLSVVAEGVETAAQAQWLREAGCQFAQGYYFSPPLSFEQLMRAL